jgi:hypothetical protein
MKGISVGDFLDPTGWSPLSWEESKVIKGRWYLRTRRTFSLASALLFMTVSPLQANDFASLGDRIWDGKVSIVRKGTSQLHEDKSGAGGTSVHKKNRDVSDTTVISACGMDILLSVYSVTRELTDQTSKHSLSEAAEVDCGLVPGGNRWKNERIIRRPGNRHEKTETRSVSLYTSKDAPPLVEMASVTLHVRPGGSYDLLAASHALTRTHEDTFEEQKDRCDDTTKQFETHFDTGKIGDPITSDIGAPEETGKVTKTVIRQTFPPLTLPAGFAAEETGTENLIRGKMLISEKKSSYPGGYNEVENGSWSFRIKDICKEVHTQLREDLAFAEAYVDPALHLAANLLPANGRIKGYEKLVNERAIEIYYGEGPPPGEGDPTTTDAVADDKWCKGDGREELKEKLQKECRPEVIYDSFVVHEDMHCEQKRLTKDFGLGNDPAVWGLQEVNAYLAGAEVLMSWLEEHCPEYDLVNEKQRVAKIIQIKTAH